MVSEQRTELIALLLALVCSVLTGAAQLTFKGSANLLRAGGLFDVRGWGLLAGSYLMLAVGLLFFLLALRRGELSTIYPLLAARYVWVVILAPVFFAADSVNLYKILGASLAAVGVVLVARGGVR